MGDSPARQSAIGQIGRRCLAFRGDLGAESGIRRLLLARFGTVDQSRVGRLSHTTAFGVLAGLDPVAAVDHQVEILGQYQRGIIGFDELQVVAERILRAVDAQVDSGVGRQIDPELVERIGGHAAQTAANVVFGRRIGVEGDACPIVVDRTHAAVAAVRQEAVGNVLDEYLERIGGADGDRPRVDLRFAFGQFEQFAVVLANPDALRGVDELEGEAYRLRILRVGQLSDGVHREADRLFGAETLLRDGEHVGADLGERCGFAELVGVARSALDGRPRDDDAAGLVALDVGGRGLRKRGIDLEVDRPFGRIGRVVEIADGFESEGVAALRKCRKRYGGRGCVDRSIVRGAVQCIGVAGGLRDGGPRDGRRRQFGGDFQFRAGQFDDSPSVVIAGRTSPSCQKCRGEERKKQILFHRCVGFVGLNVRNRHGNRRGAPPDR